MRNRMAFLSLGLMAAAGLLAATAMAADPVPAKSCTTPNYWTVTTDDGLIYDSTSNTTTITYNIGTQGNTPDHVGTFVRWEAGVPMFPPGTSATTSSLCNGESVLGIGNNAICHERIVRFNNQQSKATTFTLSVSGKRLPITTSVVVKKGNSQGACRIVGIGLADTTADSNCVHQCGQFDTYQAVRTVETYKFKGCEVAVEFSPVTGEVTNATVMPVEPNVNCQLSQGSVEELTLSGGALGNNNKVKFGNGHFASGDGSCDTYATARGYITVCSW